MRLVLLLCVNFVKVSALKQVEHVLEKVFLNVTVTKCSYP